MSTNQLTTLPDEIVELKELEWPNVRMDLSTNQLTTLPTEIVELKEQLWLNVIMETVLE